MSKTPFDQIKKKQKIKRVTTSVSIGERFDALVKDLSHNGEGVVTHPSGKMFFVPGVWPDEKVLVEVVSEKASFGHARLIEIVKASGARRPAPCQFHGFSEKQCGGCAWMFVNEKVQQERKFRHVEETLKALGVSAVRPLWCSEQALGYRTRTQVKTDGQRLGMVAPSQNTLVDIDDCLVLTPTNRQTLKFLRQTLPNARWRQGSKRARKQNNDAWVTLNFDEQHRDDKALVNARLPFQQANRPQNDRMREWIRGAIHSAVPNPEAHKAPVLELFCGAGNFTEILNQLRLPNIVAVEASESALASLKQQAWFGDGVGVDVRSIDLYQENTVEMLQDILEIVEVLVLDPPREGLKNVGALLSQAKNLTTVCYISCNLLTFVRDAKQLCAAGFNIIEVQPLDLFPQTPHIELLASFKR